MELALGSDGNAMHKNNLQRARSHLGQCSISPITMPAQTSASTQCQIMFSSSYCGCTCRLKFLFLESGTRLLFRRTQPSDGSSSSRDNASMNFEIDVPPMTILSAWRLFKDGELRVGGHHAIQMLKPVLIPVHAIQFLSASIVTHLGGRPEHHLADRTQKGR